MSCMLHIPVHEIHLEYMETATKGITKEAGMLHKADDWETDHQNR
jgi:hypothetical protein